MPTRDYVLAWASSRKAQACAICICTCTCISIAVSSLQFRVSFVQPESGCTTRISTSHFLHSSSLLSFYSRFKSSLFSFTRIPIAPVSRQPSTFQAYGVQTNYSLITGHWAIDWAFPPTLPRCPPPPLSTLHHASLPISPLVDHLRCSTYRPDLLVSLHLRRQPC